MKTRFQAFAFHKRSLYRYAAAAITGGVPSALEPAALAFTNGFIFGGGLYKLNTADP